MEIIKDFGLQPEFFIAQIINFLILAFVFKKFLYKPILKILNDREEKVRKGIEDADKAHAELENATIKSEKFLQKAALQAEKIIEETKKSADNIRVELLGKSQADANKIINEAREQAKLEAQKSEKDAKTLALGLSEKVLEKVLGELFTKEEKSKILKRNISKLEKYE
ncbi:MAG: ATP synthase F0 subunit B [Candidatus Levybacteria bacterium CG10_big_fil_rev_8_21_14_0_10_36_7]|nr:MAG: ATP synthase F0 subunit B [Candidatus Levybacteria bacterium CG10_big_fil_rev_8_21_14_0_10_36_7]